MKHLANICARATGALIFCQVKSPGWESSFIREKKSVPNPRLDLPKYIDAEARTVDNSPDLWHCVEKAYPQMPTDKATMLIVVDDLQLPLSCDDLAIDRVLHWPPSTLPYNLHPRDGCFTSPAFNRLGAVAFFEPPISHAAIPEYRFNVFANPSALPTVRLPEDFISKWKGFCRFCTVEETR